MQLYPFSLAVIDRGCSFDLFGLGQTVLMFTLMSVLGKDNSRVTCVPIYLLPSDTEGYTSYPVIVTWKQWKRKKKSIFIDKIITIQRVIKQTNK